MGILDNLVANFGTQSPQELAQLPPNVLDRLVKTFANAAMAPGNAYRSAPDNPITTEQMVKPAADLASMVTLGAGAVPAAANDLRMGIRAYHGSPHDFDKFDLAKVGTGEGVQAYGHGLYFAESPTVAQQYKDRLVVGKNTTPKSLAYRVLDSHGGNYDAALAELRNRAATGNPELMQRSNIPEAIKMLEDKAPLGRMYEVNINAEPHQFLDWDKQLSQQSNQIKELANRYSYGQSHKSIEPFADVQLPPITGANVYQGLVNNIGSRPKVSQAMAESGIPGIKYLDQGSRRLGDGTNNYVVFNPSIVDILKKYGIAGAGPLSAIMASGQNETQQ